MADSLQRTKFSVDAALKTSIISQDVQFHLARVYMMLVACTMSAALGCGSVLLLAPSVFHDAQKGNILGWVSLPITIGLMIWFLCESVEHYYRRFVLLMGICGSMGLSLVSLINLALEIDPTLIITAFLLTTVVFVCFTMVALLAERRAFLFLGGFLSSMLMILIVLQFIVWLTGNSALNDFTLYAGLAVFCLYVIFDTQMIVEKASNGDKDVLGHSLDLFLDFINIFVHILIILLKLKGGGSGGSSGETESLV